MRTARRGRTTKDDAVRIPPSVRLLLQRVGRLAEAQGVSAFAVGGCVRDWCLPGTPSPDLDVTVEGDGQAMARHIARTWGATLRVHPQFGTATVELPRGRVRRLDIATCRKETYAKPAAYPRVARGTLEEDLLRRDFTVNAMALALNPGRFGTLVDPFGGMEDLRQRRLRVLHTRSFLDDPTRLLRGIRFAQRFGALFEPATARLAREAADAGALGWLNPGRLRRELEHMLREPDPLACLRALGGWLNT